MKFLEAVRALDCSARTVMALLHVYDEVTEERHKSINRIYEFCEKISSGFYSSLSLLAIDLGDLCEEEAILPCWHTYEEYPLELAIKTMREILYKLNNDSLSLLELERKEG